MEQGERASRHRLTKPGGSPLLLIAAKYVGYLYAAIPQGDAPQKQKMGGRRREKWARRTCAEQVRKQTPSAKKQHRGGRGSEVVTYVRTIRIQRYIFQRDARTETRGAEVHEMR